MKSFEDHPFQLAAGANTGPGDQFGCLMNDAYLGHYNFMNSVTLRAEADRLDRISPEGEPE